MSTKVYVCEKYPFYSMGGVRRFGHEMKFNRGLYETDSEEEQKIVESDSFFIGGLIKISSDGKATRAPIVNSNLGMVSAKRFTDEDKEHAVMGNPQPKTQPATADDIELEVPTMRELRAMHREDLVDYAKGLGCNPTSKDNKEKLRDMIIDKTGR